MESNNLVDIPNYDNYKFDLDLLQVYNSKKNIYLKNYLSKTGYYRVSLWKNNKGKLYGIHRLVYIINNPTEDLTGYEIDHIDNDRINNNINNQSNTKTYITNKLGIKNIKKTKSNTYEFHLEKNGIRYSKTFKTLEESINYRDIKVKEICGEFSNLG